MSSLWHSAVIWWELHQLVTRINTKWGDSDYDERNKQKHIAHEFKSESVLMKPTWARKGYLKQFEKQQSRIVRNIYKKAGVL